MSVAAGRIVISAPVPSLPSNSLEGVGKPMCGSLSVAASMTSVLSSAVPMAAFPSVSWPSLCEVDFEGNVVSCVAWCVTYVAH